jgi:hypothetical protein
VTLSPPGFCDLLEVARRVVDHQVTVHDAADRMHERRDVLQHDGADRDRFDEVPITDIEVEDTGTAAQETSTCSPRIAKSAA